MRAVVCEQFGGPDLLKVRDLPTPKPDPGQIRIRLHAAGVNFPDGLIVAGSYQTKLEPPFVPGGEGCGRRRCCRRERYGLRAWRPSDEAANFLTRDGCVMGSRIAKRNVLDGNVVGVHTLSACRAGQHWNKVFAARLVPQIDYRSAVGKPFSGPSQQRQGDRVEIEALFGQPIFAWPRRILVEGFDQHTQVDQPIEPAGQDIRRDPEMRLEFAKTPRAQEAFADDQRTPTIAYDP
jgi:hypothetical protein